MRRQVPVKDTLWITRAGVLESKPVLTLTKQLSFPVRRGPGFQGRFIKTGNILP